MNGPMQPPGGPPGPPFGPPVQPLNALRPWQTAQDIPVAPQAYRPRPMVRPGAPGGPVVFHDPHHYATLNGDLVVAVSNVAPGTLVLPAPDNYRNMLMLRNSSATANIYVSFGNQASLNSTLYIPANTIILFDVVVPQDDVWAFADAASAQISVAFSTYG